MNNCLFSAIFFVVSVKNHIFATIFNSTHRRRLDNSK